MSVRCKSVTSQTPLESSSLFGLFDKFHLLELPCIWTRYIAVYSRRKAASLRFSLQIN